MGRRRNVADPYDSEKLFNFAMDQYPGAQGWHNHLRTRLRALEGHLQGRDETIRETTDLLRLRNQECSAHRFRVKQLEEKCQELMNLYDGLTDLDAGTWDHAMNELETMLAPPGKS